MNNYAMACGCNGYTWNTSQNKCTYTGTTSSTVTPQPQQSTTGSSTNTDYGTGGGGYQGGVHTEPGDGGILGTGN